MALSRYIALFLTLTIPAHRVRRAQHQQAIAIIDFCSCRVFGLVMSAGVADKRWLSGTLYRYSSWLILCDL